MFRSYVISNHQLVIRRISVNNLYPCIGVPHALIKQLISNDTQLIDSFDTFIRDKLDLPVGRYAIIDLGRSSTDSASTYEQMPLFAPVPLDNFLLQGHHSEKILTDRS